MDNLFLSREVGSIETGPQTFAGTYVLNTSFIFSSYPALPEDPGLLNSVLVQNAGRANLNGIYNYITLFENKPYYIKDSNPDWFIIWFENKWEIYDYLLTPFPLYYSSENVLYPWNVINWSVLDPIYNPTPSVTKVL